MKAKIHWDTLTKISEQDIDFGVVDTKGRAVGANVLKETVEVSHKDPDENGYSDLKNISDPGTVFRVCAHVTRDGEVFGPDKGSECFESESKADEYLKKKIDGMRIRAEKKFQTDTAPAPEAQKEEREVKLDVGHYEITYRDQTFSVHADYTGADGDQCKTVQAWTFVVDGKASTGARSKKHAIELGKKKIDGMRIRAEKKFQTDSFPAPEELSLSEMIEATTANAGKYGAYQVFNHKIGEIGVDLSVRQSRSLSSSSKRDHYAKTFKLNGKRISRERLEKTMSIRNFEDKVMKDLGQSRQPHSLESESESKSPIEQLIDEALAGGTGIEIDSTLNDLGRADLIPEARKAFRDFVLSYKWEKDFSYKEMLAAEHDESLWNSKKSLVKSEVHRMSLPFRKATNIKPLAKRFGYNLKEIRAGKHKEICWLTNKLEGKNISPAKVMAERNPEWYRDLISPSDRIQQAETFEEVAGVFKENFEG